MPEIAIRYWISLSTPAPQLHSAPEHKYSWPTSPFCRPERQNEQRSKNSKEQLATPKTDIQSNAAFGLKRETTSPPMKTELMNTHPHAMV
jgi:hypothetical protein|tara:strand:- start:287 stop:556 length:270 start_codon:yes stop_codon:yes gene_type:complete